MYTLDPTTAAAIAEATAAYANWDNLRKQATAAHTAQVRANHPSNPDWQPSGELLDNGVWVEYGRSTHSAYSGR